MKLSSTLIIAVLVVLVLLAYWSTYEVGFNQVAVKTRFGQQVAVIDQPGVGFHWPIAEKITTYDKRLQTLDTPETEVKTVDGKNIIVGAYAVWTIEDPRKFQVSVGDIRNAENQMRSRLSQVQAAVIGQSTLGEFVSLDANQVDANYDRLIKQLQDGVAPQLASDYGIKVHRVGITRISLPKETAQQVFESMRQERQALATRYEQEGNAKAEAIRARAKQAADTILSFADRRAQEIKSAGIQAAKSTLAKIPEQDRDFFEWLRWLDTLKAIFAQKTTIFIDQNTPGKLFETFVKPPAGIVVQPAPAPPGAPLPAAPAPLPSAPLSSQPAAGR